MWLVTETLSSSTVTGTFGPFPRYRDALDFVVGSEFPWTRANMESVLIQKRDEV